MWGDSGWTARFIIHGLTFHLITFYYEAVQDSVNQPVLGAPEGWTRAGGVFTDGFNQENFYSDTPFITHTHTHTFWAHTHAGTHVKRRVRKYTHTLTLSADCMKIQTVYTHKQKKTLKRIHTDFEVQSVFPPSSLNYVNHHLFSFSSFVFFSSCFLLQCPCSLHKGAPGIIREGSAPFSNGESGLDAAVLIHVEMSPNGGRFWPLHTPPLPAQTCLIWAIFSSSVVISH